MTWKDMVKKESRKIGLDERDAQDRKEVENWYSNMEDVKVSNLS